MSIKLVNSNNDEKIFYFSDITWIMLLHLCKKHNWQPEGVSIAHTIFNDDDAEFFCHWVWINDHCNSNEGNMDYFNPRYQLVEETDARKLSSILEKLIDRELIHGASQKEIPSKFCSDKELLSILIKFVKEPLVYFNCEVTRRYLREFICFCRKGGFYIGRPNTF
jgi:hypothetical protein